MKTAFNTTDAGLGRRVDFIVGLLVVTTSFVGTLALVKYFLLP